MGNRICNQKARKHPNTKQNTEALRIIKEEKQVKYYNKTPIKVETIEQYEEYINAVKYWQSIKKYDGKRKK